MKVSGSHYLFIMLFFAAATIGIGFSIAGIIAVEHPEHSMLGFRITLLIGFIGISVFHFAKGRKM